MYVFMKYKKKTGKKGMHVVPELQLHADTVSCFSLKIIGPRQYE